MNDDTQTAIDLANDIRFNGYDYTDIVEVFEAIRADERKKCAYIVEYEVAACSHPQTYARAIMAGGE